MVSINDLANIKSMSHEELLGELISFSSEETNVGYKHAVREEVLRRMKDGEIQKGVSIGGFERVSSVSGDVEVLVGREPNSVAIIPLEDCHISVVWSDVHKRLVAVISEIPGDGIHG